MPVPRITRRSFSKYLKHKIYILVYMDELTGQMMASLFVQGTFFC
ncbi:hypothetical protein CFter6_0694 [Collimonas fungivorans]|uniref:Uncharacterized protein n=1 Tax=Collimonas fungivorans TaxID=158899 RepID=A0A127P6I1_9BURK|nr:hypothetical protein CFter6_0694 [Collimonas fungivorans]